MLKSALLAICLFSSSLLMSETHLLEDIGIVEEPLIYTRSCRHRHAKSIKKQTIPIVANILGADELDANHFLVWQSLNIQGTTNAGFQVGGFAAKATQIFLPAGPATYVVTLTATNRGVSPTDLFQIVDITNGFPGTVIAIFPLFNPLLASQSVLIRTTHPSTIIAIQDLSPVPAITSFSVSIAANVNGLL